MTLSTYPISNGLPAFNLGPSFLEYAIQREMKMASIKENLIAARALLSDPARWTKNAKARSASGIATLPRSDKAVCWCAYGALAKVCGEKEANDIAWNVFLGGGNMAGFNDRSETTHSDMMTYFDRAIAAQDEVA